MSSELQQMRGALADVMRQLTSSEKPDSRDSQGLLMSEVPPRPLTDDLMLQETSIQQPERALGAEVHPSPSTSSLRQGPTSSGFAFDVARKRLQTLGLQSIDSQALSRENQLNFDATPKLSSGGFGNLRKILELDPLWQMKPEEVSRLIDVWAHGIGGMFPVVDVDKTRSKWKELSTMFARAKVDGAIGRLLIIAEALSDVDTSILKLVLTNSLTAESGGMNQTAKALFETLKSTTYGALWNSPSLNNITILVLMASAPS